MTGEDAWRCWDCRSLLDPQWKRCPYCTSDEPRPNGTAAIVEGVARSLHDAHTGRITPDRGDPLDYRRLATEAAKTARHLLFVRAGWMLDWQAKQHSEGIEDYTDLLRIWATDNERWERGS